MKSTSILVLGSLGVAGLFSGSAEAACSPASWASVNTVSSSLTCEGLLGSGYATTEVPSYQIVPRNFAVALSGVAGTAMLQVTEDDGATYFSFSSSYPIAAVITQSQGQSSSYFYGAGNALQDSCLGFPGSGSASASKTIRFCYEGSNPTTPVPWVPPPTQQQPSTAPTWTPPTTTTKWTPPTTTTKWTPPTTTTKWTPPTTTTKWTQPTTTNKWTPPTTTTKWTWTQPTTTTQKWTAPTTTTKWGSTTAPTPVCHPPSHASTIDKDLHLNQDCTGLLGEGFLMTQIPANSLKPGLNQIPLQGRDASVTFDARLIDGKKYFDWVSDIQISAVLTASVATDPQTSRTNVYKYDPSLPAESLKGDSCLTFPFSEHGCWDGNCSEEVIRFCYLAPPETSLPPTERPTSFPGTERPTTHTSTMTATITTSTTSQTSTQSNQDNNSAGAKGDPNGASSISHSMQWGTTALVIFFGALQLFFVF